MVFVTGGSGYLGRPLIAELARRGHRVRALLRPRSAGKIRVPRVEVVTGDPLRAESFAHLVQGCETFVQLVGTPKPAPWKAAEFQAIDRPAAMAGVEAAHRARVRHFVYLSVAHPAPVMKAYTEVRRHCEEALAASGLNATVLRPWYVTGPGHWWPYALVPFYALGEAIPATREGARRLGLVPHAEMIAALVWAVEHPVEGWRVVDVPGIRALYDPACTSSPPHSSSSSPR